MVSHSRTLRSYPPRSGPGDWELSDGERIGETRNVPCPVFVLLAIYSTELKAESKWPSSAGDESNLLG